MFCNVFCKKLRFCNFSQSVFSQIVSKEATFSLHQYSYEAEYQTSSGKSNFELSPFHPGQKKKKLQKISTQQQIQKQAAQKAPKLEKIYEKNATLDVSTTSVLKKRVWQFFEGTKKFADVQLLLDADVLKSTESHVLRNTDSEV